MFLGRGHSPNCDQPVSNARPQTTRLAYIALYIGDAAGRNSETIYYVGWADIFGYRG
jgi:hypothetical protein